MSEWKEHKLSEYLMVNPKIQTIKGAKYSFIEMGDLDPAYKYVDPSGKRTANGLTKFQNGDTLFAKITPCLENGKIAQARNLESNIGVGSTEFFVYRGKENISDNDFIYYLLRSYHVKEYAVRNMTGSAGHQRVPADVFDYLYIKLPDYKETIEIGKFLSSLDSKIDLLRRQNQTLENIAQTLFKRWFFDFEFPGEDGNPYKSSGGKMIDSELGGIPEGWRVGNIGGLEIVVTDFVANGSFASLKENVTLYTNKEEYALFIRNTDLKSGFSEKVFVDKHSYEFLAKSKLKGGEVIISNVGDVGSVYLCPYLKRPMTLGNNVIMLKSNINHFLYLLFISYAGQFLIYSITGGSAQPKFNKTDFKSLEIVIPSVNVLENFEINMKSIYKKITNNNQEIQTLTKTRDILLPKLMSGQIRVKDL